MYLNIVEDPGDQLVAIVIMILTIAPIYFFLLAECVSALNTSAEPRVNFKTVLECEHDLVVQISLVTNEFLVRTKHS
jgi:hypothetical protein